MELKKCLTRYSTGKYSHYINIAILITGMLAIGFVGESDMQELERAESEYNDNVENGLWPDYRSNDGY